MALFDDDEERGENDAESDEWDVEESNESSHPDPAVGDDDADGDPLADLDTVTLHEGAPSGTIKRAVDAEAGVVIYAYKNGRAGGLSTVPLSETDLAGEDTA